MKNVIRNMLKSKSCGFKRKQLRVKQYVRTRILEIIRCLRHCLGYLTCVSIATFN